MISGEGLTTKVRCSPACVRVQMRILLLVSDCMHLHAMQSISILHLEAAGMYSDAKSDEQSMPFRHSLKQLTCKSETLCVMLRLLPQSMLLCVCELRRNIQKHGLIILELLCHDTFAVLVQAIGTGNEQHKDGMAWHTCIHCTMLQPFRK